MQETRDLSQTSSSTGDSVSSAPYPPGTAVGRYRIVRELGRGGMGVVYEAHDPDLDRRVAIKLLPAHDGDTTELASRRLRREAQAMAKLSHPNLVPVFDVGTHDGHVYLAMEFMPRGTLRELLERESLTWTAIVDLYLQAGRGLAAAHDAGIVHRDFKPDNVMLGQDGRPRVLDFGVAHYTEPSTTQLSAPVEPIEPVAPSTGVFAGIPSGSLRLTQSGAMLGTPAYMAPEQLRGGVVDARSDQFSFCVCLWRAVYGVAPFAGPTMPVLADNVLSGRLEAPPRGVRIPLPLRRLLARGLSVDPGRRYPSMHELLRELESVRHLVRRRLVAAGAAAAIVIAAIPLFQSPAPAPGVCGREGERAADIWTASRKDPVRSSFVAGDQATAFERIDASIATSVSRWHDVRDNTCSFAAEQQPVAHLYERLSCLSARLVELDSFAALLASTPDEFAQRAEAVAEAAERIAAETRCDDTVALRALPPPPQDERTRLDVQRVRVELAAARATYASGRRQPALEAAQTIASRMRVVDYPAVWAEVLVLLGEIHTDAQDQAAAESTLIEAIDLAEAAGHDRVIINAATLLARLTGFQRGDLTAARMWARRATSAIAHMGGNESLTRSLHLALSRALMTRGRLDEALHEVELAHGDDHDPMASAQHALVLTLLGRYESARPFAEAGLSGWDDHHPEAAFFVGSAAILDAYEGHDVRARSSLERCIQLATAASRPQPAYAAICSSYLAVVLDRAGEQDAAAELHEQAIHIVSAQAESNVALLGQFRCQRGWHRLASGNTDAARADFQAALDAWTGSHGDSHTVLARPLTGLGWVELAGNQPDAALSLFTRAQLLRGTRLDHANEVALTLRGLAQAQVAAGAPIEAAQQALEQALGIYSGLGSGYASLLEATRTELEQLGRGHAVATRQDR